MTSPRTRALALSLLTVGYNLIEGGVAMAGSAQSGSHALFGFGLDSFIESLSGLVMVWRFWKFDLTDEEHFEEVEQTAERFVGYSFFALGLYVIIDAGIALWQREVPDPSPLGIGLALASIVVMPWLYIRKNRLGQEIGSRSLVADSKETLACLVLSIALLMGLGAFYLWRIWWLDSVVAIVIAILIIREGFETLKESNKGMPNDGPR